MTRDASYEQKSITFCITELDIGGAEQAMVRIAIGLQKKGWAVRVISLRDTGPLTEHLTDAGIPVVALGCKGFPDVRTFFRLRSELRRQPTAVLLCFLHQANIYGRLAAKSAEIPVVISGIRVADRRFSVVLPERLTRCCVDHYIAVSESVARTHAQICGIPAERMTAIPNGVDPAAGSSDRQFCARNFNLLFVGRLTKQKDPRNLLEAFCRLSASLKDCTRLTIAGDGPLRPELEQFVDRHQLTQNVCFLGHRDDIAELMKMATLLVLPSRWEGMPNVVLEAMAEMLPVVATGVDGTRDLISHSRYGWLVPPQNPDLLSAAISEALNSPQKRQQVAQEALQHVRESFSWEIAVEKYSQLLNSLLAR